MSLELFPSEQIDKLEHETPFFLFSKKKIVEKYKEFQKFFPKSHVFYAMKANAEPEVLKILHEAGSGFEVASIYELAMLKKLSVPADKIIYGSALKATKHIQEFYEYGVRTFAFDSLSELQKIAAVAPGSKVYVRISVDDTGSVFRFSEKFGTEKNNARPLLMEAQKLGLVPCGISFHVGSQASNPNAWAHALVAVGEIMKEVKSDKITLDIVNLGGGYPCRYVSYEEDLDLEEIAEHTLAQYKKLPYQPTMYLEPGRGIIAEAGVAVTTVIGKVERGGDTWLFLDVGVYNGLFETLAYQGSTRYRVTSLRHSYDVGETMFALAGPTGDSMDVITREALLPRDIDVGDKLVIHDVGAYSLVASSQFNGFPKPPVHFV